MTEYYYQPYFEDDIKYYKQHHQKQLLPKNLPAEYTPSQKRFSEFLAHVFPSYLLIGTKEQCLYWYTKEWDKELLQIFGGGSQQQGQSSTISIKLSSGEEAKTEAKATTATNIDKSIKWKKRELNRFMVNKKKVNVKRLLFMWHYDTLLSANSKLVNTCRDKECINPAHVEILEEEKSILNSNNNDDLLEKEFNEIDNESESFGADLSPIQLSPPSLSFSSNTASNEDISSLPHSPSLDSAITKSSRRRNKLSKDQIFKLFKFIEENNSSEIKKFCLDYHLDKASISKIRSGKIYQKHRKDFQLLKKTTIATEEKNVSKE